MKQTALRANLAEFIGTFFLLTTVIGSGIMAERLAGGNDAIALLCNTIPTGAILAVIIQVFAPISGAHFNPAVTAVFLVRKEIEAPRALSYVAFQIAGGLLGAIAAHVMFDLPAIASGIHERAGMNLWVAEAIATGGLILAILGARQANPASVPWAVGLYITAAYWFTASTSFANPAVTIARGMTPTFSGIVPGHVLAFIVAQLVGALLIAMVWKIFEDE